MCTEVYIVLQIQIKQPQNCCTLRNNGLAIRRVNSSCTPQSQNLYLDRRNNSLYVLSANHSIIIHERAKKRQYIEWAQI